MIEAEYDTSASQGQSRIVSSTPTKDRVPTARTQLLYSLSPKSTGSAQQDLIETEERSLTSLLNGALDDQPLESTNTMPSMDGMHDDSFSMLTLVRPSMIPEDVEQSPAEKIKELQRAILRANNKITELEAEKSDLTQTTKELRIQLNVMTDMLEEMKLQMSNPDLRLHKHSKKHDEMQKRNITQGHEFAAKGKEIQALTSKLKDLQTECITLKEENELLEAKLASLGEASLAGRDTLVGDGEKDALEAEGKGIVKPKDHPLSIPDTPEQQQNPKFEVPNVEKVGAERNQNKRKLTVRAFRGLKDRLSNFYDIGENKLPYSGKYFNSSEKAYQHTKAIFHGKRNLAKEILSATDPSKIKKLGDYRESVAWKKQKVAFLQEILMKKAACCPEFRAEVSDPNVVFVEAVQDQFWGSGMNFVETCSTRPGQWTGANVMGMLLSQVCSKLPTIPKPRLTTTSTVKLNPNTNTSEGTDMGERDANKIARQGNTTDQKEKNVLTIIGDSMTAP